MTVDLRFASPASRKLPGKREAAHREIVHCFVGSRDRNRSDLHTRQLCFLQLFLWHTLRAGTRRELGGAAMHSRRRVRTEKGEGGCRCRGQHSRVFLVPIHNCKFPSPYLCSPSSHRPGSVCRFANTGLSTTNSSGSDSADGK